MARAWRDEKMAMIVFPGKTTKAENNKDNLEERVTE